MTYIMSFASYMSFACYIYVDYYVSSLYYECHGYHVDLKFYKKNKAYIDMYYLHCRSHEHIIFFLPLQRTVILASVSYKIREM